MATLTEVSYYTRKIIKWGGVIFFILLISPAILRGAKSLYLALRPPPPPPPTVKYGKLPKPYFPERNTDYKPTYRLETVEGTLPQTSTVGRVYFVEINKSRLLELERWKPKARILGFDGEPVESGDGQVYSFTHPTLPAVMNLNIISGTMNYKFDWTLDQSLYSAQGVPTTQQAFIEAKAFLQNLGLLPQDLSEGVAKYAYFRASPPTMTSVTSLSEANFLRVDIFRADKDELPFVATDGLRSPVNLTFSGVTDRNKRIIELNYQYSRILDEDFATYPLKTSDAAWAELQQGGGFISQKAGDEVVIREVYMAYYESSEPQQFLQPVFTFEGDNGFVAFVPAIDPAFQQ